MYRVFLFFLTLSLNFSAIAQNYKPVDEGSKVHFNIKNFGVNTGGDLSGLKGDIFFNAANPVISNFSVSAAVKTIDTDSENRDKHLRSEGYFDAEKYPDIIIKSTKITAANSTSGMLHFTGTLTMHGITRNIAFPFTATRRGDDYVFSGEFEINRLDYAVGEASAVLSKTVKVSLSVLAKKD